MFQSGEWDGYWVQSGVGRGRMHPLALTFTPDGTISGGGRDRVGEFTFKGKFNELGEVTLRKQYAGAHSVSYKGRADADGGISGTWSIGGYLTGDFVLKPGSMPPTPAVRKTRAKRPAEAPKVDAPPADTSSAVTPAEPEHPHPLRRRRKA